MTHLRHATLISMGGKGNYHQRKICHSVMWILFSEALKGPSVQSFSANGKCGTQWATQLWEKDFYLHNCTTWWTYKVNSIKASLRSIMLDYLTVFQSINLYFFCGCEGIKDVYLKSEGLREAKCPDSPPVWLCRGRASFQDTLEHTTQLRLALNSQQTVRPKSSTPGIIHVHCLACPGQKSNY